MICPHCQTSLLYRQRPKRICSSCGRPFALEPKESPFRLHDLRVQRLADKLSDGRGLLYTGPQLYFAAGRKTLPSTGRTYTLAAIGYTVLLAIIGTVLLASGVLPVGPGLAGVAAVIVAVNLLLLLIRPQLLRRSTIRMDRPYPDFGTQVLRPWRRIYGAPPPRLVPDNLPLPAVPQPRIALLCPDRSTLACLAANGAATTWGMALCARLEQVPPNGPVLVLHDASVAGIGWARQVREALGPRAALLGLSPASVRTAPWAVRVKEHPMESAELPPAIGAEDRQWLLDGWWSPVAALPPARLLRLVQRGVDRAEEAADPDRRRAGQVGFLTWPAPA
ncbi:hypothetical protein [Nocardia asteroides]|uniref:hypothetical protein n=1 Tax=Nocardia asteroides TaxID=1824 RepID=UPI001E58DD75|nr:hypothetical protein [Nocardia asteroides]UGT61879.1 hypothetical protein LTT61_00540 [Nocardia asteroides]